MTDADRRADYEALVRAVIEPLRRYAARRTDAATADDVVADVLLVLWRRLADVPTDGALPWCYGVARGCLANAERSRRRWWNLTARVARLDPPPEADPLEASDSDPELLAALRGLSAEDQELLRLWAWEDLAPREIAVVLGVTPNAVSIRLHRAKGRLAEELSGPPASPGKGRHGAGQIPADDTEGAR